jgi:hypothetical protein
MYQDDAKRIQRSCKPVSGDDWVRKPQPGNAGRELTEAVSFWLNASGSHVALTYDPRHRFSPIEKNPTNCLSVSFASSNGTPAGQGAGGEAALHEIATGGGFPIDHLPCQEYGW